MSETPLFAQLGYSKELYDIRQKNGNWLLFVAWCVEIAAAAIGFAIAGITIWQALEGRSGQDNTSQIAFWGTALVGGLPFAMCGIVELCKIPIATLVYHSERLFWKLLFIGAMVLLSIVTFETMAAGMQQSYQLRTGAIQVLAQQIMQKEQALKALEKDLAAREGKNNERARFSERRTLVIEEARSRKEQIDLENDKKNNSARESFGDSKSASTQASLNQLRADRKVEDERFENDLRTININSKAKTDSQIESHKNRLISVSKKRETASNDLATKLDECKNRMITAGTCREKANNEYSSTKKDLDSAENEARKADKAMLSEIEAMRKNEAAELRLQHQNARTRISNRIDVLSAELAKSSSTTRDDLEKMLRDNEIKRQERIEAVDNELEQELQRIKEEQTEYLRESAPENINAIRNTMRENRLQSDEMKARLDAETSQNQTYQIAKLAKSMCLFVPDRASCKSEDEDIRMADMPSSYVDKIAMFWFGSLAFIISTTGVLLAFGAMVLKYEHISQRRNSIGIFGLFAVLGSQVARIWNAAIAYMDSFFVIFLKMLKSLRKLIITKRMAALREPRVIEKIVEITNEIPVEQIIIKEVEVIKEVPVEKVIIKEVEVVKEVPVEKIVTKEIEVIKEVPVEKIVTKEVEVIKEVLVDKIITQEVPVDRVVIQEVEVVKEVPVEKVVTREIEKKVPVKSKEFVYVPFYTDDPEERDTLNEKIRMVEGEMKNGGE